MSKHYILDGYNIIKSDETETLCSGTLEQQRNKLIALVDRNKPQGSLKNLVTIVFDGKNDNPFDSEGFSLQKVNNLDIVFSKGTTADRIIEKLVNESNNPSNMVVITNDRGIRKLLGPSGAAFLTVEKFFEKLFGVNKDNIILQESSKTQNYEDINKEFLDKWGKN
ncbi:NYN domain-containing protein [Elusimicrobiota bacterium]